MTTLAVIDPVAARSALARYMGVSESPPGSNHQQFSPCCGRPFEAWCDDYQCCVFWRDLAFDFGVIGLPPTGVASCVVHCSATKRAGWFSFLPRVHAWVFFGPSGSSHIEYVISLELDNGVVWDSIDPIPAGRHVVAIHTIGGNTSAPNNYAGGTVAAHRRVLGAGDDIYGYGYVAAPAPTPHPTTPEDDEDMRPFVVKLPSPETTAYLVGGVNPVTGKLIALQMTDANDLRNPPDGYGPAVEITQASMDTHIEH